VPVHDELAMLLFETFPEATLFARQLAQRSGKVVRLWPDARGWVVENLTPERKPHDMAFCGHEDSTRSPDAAQRNPG
jgi:hypothetical protein